MADGNASLKRKHSKAFYVGNKKKVCHMYFFSKLVHFQFLSYAVN